MNVSEIKAFKLREASKKPNKVPGGYFHVNLCGMYQFSGYQLLAYIPEQSVKIDKKFLNRLRLFL